MVVESAETIRRRIALYRRYIRDGVESELALRYLREIVEMEWVLTERERDELDP